MIEVEMKCPIHGREGVRQRLAAQGFVLKHRIRETDVYYDNASGEIRRADGALRVRTVENLQDGSCRSVVTRKGKRMDTVSMTRQELETEVADGLCMGRIFEGLGYMPVEPKVIKIREEYLLGEAAACLDQVEGLGDFLELEIMAEEGKPEAKEQALGKLEELLAVLGYRMEDTVTVSYLSMLQSLT